MARHVAPPGRVAVIGEQVVRVAHERVPPNEREELFPQSGQDPILRSGDESGGDGDRFLAGRGSVEPDAALALEPLHPCVERPPEDHPLVRGDEGGPPVRAQDLGDFVGSVGEGDDSRARGHAISAKSWCGSSR